MKIADSSKLRAYFFGNMYIAPIQHGIQAAHVVTKLFATYGRDYESDAADVLYDWADLGVTKILLNGGYQSNLETVHTIFDIIAPKLGLPFAKFHEEEAALNGALTSVGIVVPEEVYCPAELEVFSWTQPPAHGYDMGYLYECLTPDAILAKLLEYKGRFAGDLEESFLEIALYLTLKSCRLA